MRVYIASDPQMYFENILHDAYKLNITSQDLIILCGDVGFNYYGDVRDIKLKRRISREIQANILCVHGNREMNPEYMLNMRTICFAKGITYYEKEYPNILYAKDGEIYDINGLKTIVLGGAYSVDKFYRISNNWHWFADEQMNDSVKKRCISHLEQHNYNVDVVLSHTTPYEYMSEDLFIKGIDQSTVDQSMEKWLQMIYDNIQCKIWYAGHYHCDRKIDNVHILTDRLIDFYADLNI